MQAIAFGADGAQFLDAPQASAAGFLWLSCTRDELARDAADIQSTLLACAGADLLGLHVSDLCNASLPSRFEDTLRYDLMVLRRLSSHAPGRGADHPTLALIDLIETDAVGFVVFDRVLLSVHGEGCLLREHFFERVRSGAIAEGRGGARLPSSAAELMLRMLSTVVDGYLDLRRQLTRHLEQLQRHLLNPRSRFNNWQSLLDARTALQALDDTCEDQRGALQAWIESAASPSPAESSAELEMLRVRSLDVLEHVERVLGHVRRLAHGAETAVQMHFSAIAHRTNSIMRTLTVLTAIFMPLNLITGFFGMNFDTLPLIHRAAGAWIALGLMAALGAELIAYFWRKRYLSISG